MGTEQKVAVITGASQGIGAALIKAYRDRNYRVVATARSIKPSNDDDVLSVAGDIADPKTVERGDKNLHRIDTVHHSSPAATAGGRPMMPEAVSRILPFGERVPVERRAFVRIPNERIFL